MNIRLVALDLDGTTMNSDNRLSDYNRKTLEATVQAGIQVVVASGRAFDALPKEVLAIPGLQYAISSNGAHITDLTTGKFIYSSYITPTTVDRAIDLAVKEHLMVEAFCHGKPYISEALYEDIRVNGSVYRNKEYVMTTRTPIPDIGGINSSKAHALEILSRKLEIPREGIMSFGDAGNDIPMIRYAGMGVAVGNAWDDVKAAADYVAESNDEDGVGRTIRRFALGEKL